MAPRLRTTTTRLPATLVGEISRQPADARHKGKKIPAKSRKEVRKEGRDQKKERKATFFSAGAKRTIDEHEDAPKAKKIRLDAATGPPLKSAKEDESVVKKKVTMSALKQKNSVLEKKAVAPRPQKEIEDDRYIAYLEAKLGYGKGKKASEDDGLDDLLDFSNSIGLAGVEEEDDMEDEEELELEDFYSTDEDDDDEAPKLITPVADEEVEAEWGGIDDDDDAEVTTPQDKPPKQPVKTTTYRPPHLRTEGAPAAPESQELIKLRRNLNGLLNRMSEQNLANILDSVEELYRNNRRNDVTSSLTSLIIDGISSHSLLLDSYVVLHAAFIASLHKILGIEFAANFVQNVVFSYEAHYAALTAGTIEAGDDSKGKECSNLLILLAELYNFQVISCILVYDLTRSLLSADKLTEVDVELLLKLIRSTGTQLRLDDPSALKDITHIVRDKVSEKPSSRTQFMIETLTNLKNDKTKKLGTQNQGGEAVERMKKFLSSLGKKRHVVANEPLRVSLADLHSAETRGKWWLVGAAWAGDPLLETKDKVAEKVAASSSLLKLAKKQGMNTDIRRSIFVILMSSDDYIDACERLAQLNLTEVQQREIVRVLLHCCGNEKSYNPYYTLVAQHLSRTSHSYKITLQFCLWDFLRDLGQSEVGGAEVIKSIGDSFELKSISTSRRRNVARAYAWWVAKDTVSLAILKPIDFTVLRLQSSAFLKEFFVQLFVSSQVSTPVLVLSREDMVQKNRKAVEEVFIKATRAQALAMGIVYFLSGWNPGEDEFVEWAREVAMDTLRTGVDVVPDL